MFRCFTHLVSVVVVGSTLTSTVHAQQPRTIADGVYTAAQAQRGGALYTGKCLPCHGPMLQGLVGPPLAGPDFLSNFGTLPLSALAIKIKTSMPKNDPGKLTPQEVSDLVAYVLQFGKFPAGSAELSGDEAALQQITWPVTAAPSRSVAAAAVSFPPTANLAQVMRGILFPSSNIIFNVQRSDPGAQKSYEVGKADPSLVDWGNGIYKGWELVENAALSIADAAPLIVAPDRRCENGKRVPVTNPDWIKFTQDLVAAAQASYRAAQTRSQDAVSESTDKLADACFSCHIVYRDKLGGTEIDPSNKAARCVQ